MHPKPSNSHHTDPLSVNQIKKEFTSKEITSSGVLSIIERFLEEIKLKFKVWVERGVFQCIHRSLLWSEAVFCCH